MSSKAPLSLAHQEAALSRNRELVHASQAGALTTSILEVVRLMSRTRRNPTPTPQKRTGSFTTLENRDSISLQTKGVQADELGQQMWYLLEESGSEFNT